MLALLPYKSYAQAVVLGFVISFPAGIVDEVTVDAYGSKRVLDSFYSIIFIKNSISCTLSVIHLNALDCVDDKVNSIRVNVRING